MDLQLSGKRALVTGSSSGIGAGIARILAAEGANVMVQGRNRERCEAVAAEIRAAGGTADFILGDLALEDGTTAVAEAVAAWLGGIDILVNNTGGRASSQRGGAKLNPPWLETPWSDWLWTFEQNIGAAVRLIQHLTPAMKARGWGRIINIGSSSATQTGPDLAEYQAVKAAMVNMTTSLARTLSFTGITVNTVTPGTILTPAVKRTFTDMAGKMGMDPDDWDAIETKFAREIHGLAVDHFGRPEDIGRMVALLASPLSSYMTGANYRVDGGFVRSIN
ncbi:MULTISPECIES: SDR family NAD(P)-dependent oxidoreductase [unclassified Sphingobium]|uniref:SDR family NAD(P)-dependent oxidoreductase n=1 Tax=unclassified Sphingobium TaxID=2611147 RepID=UPI000D17E767|nr:MULTISPECIES: SDR family oxidoreductase [unclassified Sphingobium]MBG6120007.1 NAD(P)-dependent dehydrogenase (short-subunit alcohol dehydrogenase family) [Sphingobium sp. JAI105]PSO12932.1 short-chain dehydrogenase [Sphingobium sp. AEW4]TWD05792.1 NAD(P)-dependent dehydrogenase (short-subunit alcohol dehydrogenase family) [Sphingobium sp. AEW010]TWD23345.1 NAD(P)-dependent dehydrogenase (short-subunit alcohol dehydrogenase family) [Sphingobium sp. AEW013]TWD25205.1 NAD(P)-dependent dehydro